MDEHYDNRIPTTEDRVDDIESEVDDMFRRNDKLVHEIMSRLIEIDHDIPTENIRGSYE